LVEDGAIIHRRLSVSNNEHGRKLARLNFKMHLSRAGKRKIHYYNYYVRIGG
jgi:hypothetical protein